LVRKVLRYTSEEASRRRWRTDGACCEGPAADPSEGDGASALAVPLALGSPLATGPSEGAGLAGEVELSVGASVAEGAAEGISDGAVAAVDPELAPPKTDASPA
jgi:hypothetical protein